MRNLTKRFGSVLANSGVNLRVEAATIHGVVGENGAGKSTAMKMLYGMFPPDSGEILVENQAYAWRSPAAAIARGIGMVHQHFMLAGAVTVLDNILLGAEPRRFGMIDRSRARARLESLAQQYGLPVEWDSAVEGLPVGMQQRIEILKLLYRGANLLILDEPTAVLTPQETKDLFTNLRRLRAEGKTILLITHKLNEVMAITDRVSVFRAGQVVGEVTTAATNPEELASLMVGRQVMLDYVAPPAQPRSEPALDVLGLNLAGLGKGRRPRLSEISFSVKQGEIVGIAGVEGNGQSELFQAILHCRDPHCRSSGSIRVLGQDVTHSAAAQIRDLGVGLIPEDRHREGLLLEWSLQENYLLGLHRGGEFARSGFRQEAALKTAAERAIAEYDVRPAESQAIAGRLSGGNQQKLIIAREFHRQPRLILAAQPTRGVDVGAIEFIRRRMVQARDEGAGVLLVSFELEEVLALSDRILVMFGGRIVAEFYRGQVTERELGLKMGGL